MRLISSPQNELIKTVIKLNKANERKQKDLIIIEGGREINLSIKAGFKIEILLFCKTFTKNIKEQLSELTIKDGIPEYDAEILEVSENVFSRIAYREKSDGLLAVAKPKHLQLSDINLTDNPLLLLVETVEKPGNLGAILRTADAAGVDGILICDNQTDIYNPNIIRSSLGSIFTNSIVNCTNEEAYNFLKEKKIKIFASSLKAEKSIYESDIRKPSAILVGSEAFGLTEFWHKKADELIKIPMFGKVDSLNVSVSVGIIIYESRRQRIENS